MASACQAYLLCDRCDPTVLMDYPIKENATAAPKVEVTTNNGTLTVNAINQVSGAAITVRAPTMAEGNVFTVNNVSLHSVTLQDSTGTTDLASLEPGAIVTYIYDGGALRVY